MKKILNLIIAALIALCSHSCKIDNYDAPSETLKGQITDGAGNPLQLEQGASSARLKLEELKFKNPAPLYLNFKQDGSYINSKIFAGRYRVFPIEGPFYPLDSAKMKIVDVSGITTTDFQVVPYLNVEWVGEPTVGPDKKVTVSFKFTRNPAPAGLVQPALKDYQFFISTTQYVGNNNYDNTRVTPQPIAVTATSENQVITLTSAQPMKYSTIFYLRIGVRVSDTFQKYNYTTVKTVTVP